MVAKPDCDISMRQTGRAQVFRYGPRSFRSSLCSRRFPQHGEKFSRPLAPESNRSFSRLQLKCIVWQPVESNRGAKKPRTIVVGQSPVGRRPSRSTRMSLSGSSIEVSVCVSRKVHRTEQSDRIVPDCAWNTHSVKGCIQWNVQRIEWYCLRTKCRSSERN